MCSVIFISRLDEGIQPSEPLGETLAKRSLVTDDTAITRWQSRQQQDKDSRIEKKEAIDKVEAPVWDMYLIITCHRGGLGPSGRWAAGAFTPGQQFMNHDKPCLGMDPTAVPMPSAAPRIEPLWDHSCSSARSDGNLDNCPSMACDALGPSGAQYRRKGASDGQQEFRRVVCHCFKTSETHDGNYTCIPGYAQLNRGTQKTSRDDLGRNGIPGSGPATAMLRPPSIEIAPDGRACCLEPETGKRDR